MTQLTKHQKIKVHLESGKTITSKQAWRQFGHSRLASVIERLRNREGLPIKKETIHEDGANFARYSMEKTA